MRGLTNHIFRCRRWEGGKWRGCGCVGAVCHVLCVGGLDVMCCVCVLARYLSVTSMQTQSLAIQVQGMTELNTAPPRQIKVTGPFSFTIEDTTGYSAYKREGIASQVKVAL